jgi:hypothetical protein
MPFLYALSIHSCGPYTGRYNDSTDRRKQKGTSPNKKITGLFNGRYHYKHLKTTWTSFFGILTEADDVTS